MWLDARVDLYTSMWQNKVANIIHGTCSMQETQAYCNKLSINMNSFHCTYVSLNANGLLMHDKTHVQSHVMVYTYIHCIRFI